MGQVSTFHHGSMLPWSQLSMRLLKTITTTLTNVITAYFRSRRHRSASAHIFFQIKLQSVGFSTGSQGDRNKRGFTEFSDQNGTFL